MLLYPALRRLLFQLDPETSHGLGLGALRAAQGVPGAGALLARHHLLDAPPLRQTLFGRDLPNPVGLAAGFDKDAAAVLALPALGLGFAEVGTVTPLPQVVNPKPRLFRHAAARSLQNSLGFNNGGMAAMRRRLERIYPAPLALGVNVGKNKATPPEKALTDYESLIRGLHDVCDYLVVNLSSPNTPGLRDLQNETFLRALFGLARGITARPILVKIAPDLEPAAAVALCEAAVDAGAAGVIATNTTTDYSLLPGAQGSGGLSGPVLREGSFRVFSAVAAALFGRAVLISVGGIDSGAEAYRRLKAGASLVQVYTALVYEGPGLPRRINRELLALLARDGAKSLAEVIGADIARA
jgi:dihydroorotate dehydrogenase